MNDATINRTVAERLGWTCENNDINKHPRHDLWRNPEGRWADRHPSFATSLDAMAEAEATLNPNERSVYMDRLWDLGDWEAICAPARTRALAFIDATKGREASE